MEKEHDIDVKLGSKEQKMWHSCVLDTETQINRLKDQLVFLSAVLEMAKIKETEEAKKFEAA